MTVGEKATVTVPAAEAYGSRDDNQVQAVPPSSVPEEVEVGSRLQAKTGDGREVALTVVGVDDAQVTVAANHPLAGKELTFDVEVVEIGILLAYAEVVAGLEAARTLPYALVISAPNSTICDE